MTLRKVPGMPVYKVVAKSTELLTGGNSLAR